MVDEADIQLNQSFHWLDWLIFTAFLVATLGISLFHGVRHKMTAEEFHSGDRDFKIIPVAISLMSAFLSAILILGTPAEIYTQGTLYWLYSVGMMLACVLGALLFVPLLYPLRLTSAYEVVPFSNCNVQIAHFTMREMFSIWSFAFDIAPSG